MKKLFYAVLAMGMCATLSAAPVTEPLKPETMFLQTTIQPGPGEAVSLALAKKHLNIEAEYIDDDLLIQTYIATGVGFVQGYTGRPFYGKMVCNQYGFEDFHFVALPKILSVTASYQQMNDLEEIESIDLPAENFTVTDMGDGKSMVVFNGDLPDVMFNNPNAVTVTFNIGPPAEFISAVLLKVGEAYAFRENRQVNSPNNTVYDLCRAYRINWS